MSPYTTREGDDSDSSRQGAAGTIRLGVTLGDPAGVGPEIVARLMAAQDDAGLRGVQLTAIGRADDLERGARCAGISLDIAPLEEPGTERSGSSLEPRGLAPRCVVVEPASPAGETPGDRFEPVAGRVEAACGAAARAAVETAVRLVEQGRIDAIVTAPLNKEALRRAGCLDPGHTELLARLAGAPSVGMLLVGGGLRVALATIHEPLSEVPGLITTKRLVDLLRMMDEFIPWFFDPPGPAAGAPRRKARIAVAALNPHASEAGLFGHEEKTVIAPAIDQAARQGIDVAGPLPADTLFHRHREGEFDAVLAMYHDQAIIPVKTLDFHHGVNVTMGLPFIRTSVDHGTAFELAGRGLANPSSLHAAVACAAQLVRNRRRFPR